MTISVSSVDDTMPPIIGTAMLGILGADAGGALRQAHLGMLGYPRLNHLCQGSAITS